MASTPGAKTGRQVAVRLALLVWTLLAATAALAQPFVIERFDADLDLRRDGGMAVTEKIQVLFRESRRGIFRVIPVVYPAGRGLARRIVLSGIAVEDESGAPMTTKITREGPNVRIRIGDEDVWLPQGTRLTYVIRYGVKGMLNWFEGTSDWGHPTAELYWNVTGNEWETTIERSSCRIRFPEDGNPEALRARIFVGPYGSTDSQLLSKPADNVADDTLGTIASLGRGRFFVECERPIGIGSGLTVVLAIPAEAIPRPSFVEAAWIFIVPNSGFLVPVFVLPALALFWFVFGRDPRAGPRVTQFEPPEGLSGPEIGAMIDERVDKRDIAAGFISLAVKGYLRIHPKETGFLFKQRTADLEVLDKPAGADLTSFERNLLSYLGKVEGRITETDLRTKVAPHLQSLTSTLYQQLVARGYYLKSPQTVRAAWATGGILVCVLLAIASTMTSPVSSPLSAWVGGGIGVVMVLLFSRGMPRRTPHGARVRSQAEGFEEFIRRARADELEHMAKRQPDMALFEEYLPHAVAFGLTAVWIRAFEGILVALPSWYAAPHGTPFNSYAFSSDLDSINNTVANAASTPPRSSGASGGSSGFGGGGFSGGGFGGGGGGSW